MADHAWITLGTSLASAVGGSVLTYVATVLKIRQDLAAQYDADLRRDRIGVYKHLWKALEPLARYAPPGEFTFNKAHNLAVALRAWYFEEGGLFLSEPARDAYFDLQKALKGLGDRSDHAVPQATLETLMGLGSELRTHLSQDVGTRQQAMLKHKVSPAAR
jgi:hypothetical protein